MWDLIVSLPDHCLSFYLEIRFEQVMIPFIHKFCFLSLAINIVFRSKQKLNTSNP